MLRINLSMQGFHISGDMRKATRFISDENSFCSEKRFTFVMKWTLSLDSHHLISGGGEGGGSFSFESFDYYHLGSRMQGWDLRDGCFVPRRQYLRKG